MEWSTQLSVMKSQTSKTTYQEVPQANSGFVDLGVAQTLNDALVRLQCITPTPIQHQAIPAVLEGKDIVGIAQTGTGKTFAFGIPMIQRLAQVKGQGLVVLPTRELATQVDEALRQIGKDINLRVAVLIGGVDSKAQVRALARKPHIIVATPGRLIDHIEQKNLTLDAVRVVVLDEADRMLDMGFAPQIKKIFDAMPQDRQTLLFSATMPHEIMRIATTYMKLPIRVEVAPPGTTVERVTQELFLIQKDGKDRLIAKLLDKYSTSILIFTRTKHGGKRLTQRIRAMGHSAAEIHSNRSVAQRREALEGFKSGKYRILVATDIAARGIDVADIGLVINYDLPEDPEDYVHRIGRTARAGAGGHAISFVTPEQQAKIGRIERLIKVSILVSQTPDLPHLPRMPYQPQVEQTRRYDDKSRVRSGSRKPKFSHDNKKTRSNSPHSRFRGRNFSRRKK
jgi:ATP-dependent RNA helicase RhlE